MKAPRKVYILKNNEYIEITLQEHEALQKTMPGYLDKKFVFLHDCLMEVSESFYLDFYKDKRRQKYLDECAAQYGTISYDMLSTDDFNGEDSKRNRNQRGICRTIQRICPWSGCCRRGTSGD